jgi:hypothetical protein
VFITAPAAGEYANVPATLAAAFNCALPRAVPTVIGAGVVHVTVGVALLTVREFLAVADATSVGSLGVNVAFRVWVPTFRTVPDDGEYVNVPG